MSSVDFEPSETQNERNNNINSNHNINNINKQKVFPAIPELMIPSFETIEDGTGQGGQMEKPMISPDSTATTNSTAASLESRMEHEGAVSPTNPSAPLTSPPRADKQQQQQQQTSHATSGSNSPPAALPPKSNESDISNQPPPPSSSTTNNSNSNPALTTLNDPPVPISQRARVVSLDRGGYLTSTKEFTSDYDNDDSDDHIDDKSSSSMGSTTDTDGEGSYFSEQHLPSPPRRRESISNSNTNPRLLPPGRGGGGSMNMSMSQRSQSQSRSVQMPSVHNQPNYSIAQESDLSLSSSSSEDETYSHRYNKHHQQRQQQQQQQQQQQHHHHQQQQQQQHRQHLYHQQQQQVEQLLDTTYDFNRTNSAPAPSEGLSTLQPRTTIEKTISDGLDREKLIIGLPMMDEQLNAGGMPLPKNHTRRFPSTSSLVSSSSEDIERINNSGFVGTAAAAASGVSGVSGAAASGAAASGAAASGSGVSSGAAAIGSSGAAAIGSNGDANGKPSKHRRQSSYRSVGSITSAGSAFLPEKPKQSSNGSSEAEIDNEHSRPPELVSFTGGSGGTSSRHRQHKSSNSSSSKRSNYDQRVPKNKSYSDLQKNQPVSVLKDDQMNLWLSGNMHSTSMGQNDSYMSSSHGNTTSADFSPDRASKSFLLESASLSNCSKHSRNKSVSSHISRSGSGIFNYSEDDTDDSILKDARSSRRDYDAASAAGSQVSQRRPTVERKRSFGKDLTNADVIEKVGGRNAQINPSPGRRTHQQLSNQSDMMAAMNNYDQPGGNFGNDLSYGTTNDSISEISSKYFRVYWKRWLMLFYISMLNLLSDWTCFSVAPIAMFLAEAFQNVNPEHLVTLFLFANTLATATEPILLARLGLRNTIVFGSFLLMLGNVIKSGGIPGILGDGLHEENNSVWRLYTGFFLVGLSQPLYQCTPSILSSSWFPEKERTLATGVALNSNQLGIGCSFVFGSLLVVSTDDIPNYFGLLSLLSTLVFIGCYFQFQDAPPTPPSDTARVMRGNAVLPYMNMNIQQNIPQYLRRFQGNVSSGREQIDPPYEISRGRSRFSSGSAGSSESKSSWNRESEANPPAERSNRRSKKSERKNRGSPTSAFKSASSRVRGNRPRKSSSDSQGKSVGQRRQRSNGSKSMRSEASSRSRSRRKELARSLVASPACGNEPTEDVIATITELENEAACYGAIAPSPMMPGRVGRHNNRREGDQSFADTPQRHSDHNYQQPWNHTPYRTGSDLPPGPRHPYPPNPYGQYYNNAPEHLPADHVESFPETPFANLRYTNPPMTGNYSSQIPSSAPYDYRDAPINYYHPIADPRLQHYHQPPVPPEFYHYQQSIHAPYYHPSEAPLLQVKRGKEGVDDGVEPVLTLAGSNLSIDIRDDQILRSIRACFSRPGFFHTVIAFAVSGTVLNTISTYLDSLLRLVGAGRGAVGIVGGSFQVIVMISSMMFGKITDKGRAYYCVVIGLLVMGAFALAECAINLEGERGTMLKWTLLFVAIFVGPLQPVATELGVEVVYPLSGNTVLVVQQLVSNLASALFIPFFQQAKDFAVEGDGFERPQYTFSFIILMAMHVIATVFFATFNGSYKRFEHEKRKKKEHSNDLKKGSSSSLHKGDIVDEEQALLV